RWVTLATGPPQWEGGDRGRQRLRLPCHVLGPRVGAYPPLRFAAHLVERGARLLVHVAAPILRASRTRGLRLGLRRALRLGPRLGELRPELLRRIDVGRDRLGGRLAPRNCAVRGEPSGRT